MYATCLFCNNALGANETIEHFPIGRRLAYDEAAGRLWVVCQTCERWNLSPIESRWEAIEEAERAFRGTKVRVSSENIGMARLRDGTELVRIGKPPRIEFAVWRYGDQFGKRRRRTMQITALTTTGGLTTLALVMSELWAGSLALSTVATMTGVGTFLNLAYSFGSSAVNWRQQNKLRATVSADDGSAIRLSSVTMKEVAFVRGDRDFDWKLRVPRHVIEPNGLLPRLLGVHERAHGAAAQAYLHGDTAQRALANILPHLNSEGASKRRVNDAMIVVNDASSVQQLLQRASKTKPKYRSDSHVDGGLATLGGLPAPMRLALEMSLHEDDERRAMEGELHVLEQRWRDADTIARIADNLLLPDGVVDQLKTLQDRKGGTE